METASTKQSKSRGRFSKGWSQKKVGSGMKKAEKIRLPQDPQDRKERERHRVEKSQSTEDFQREGFPPREGGTSIGEENAPPLVGYRYV